MLVFSPTQNYKLSNILLSVCLISKRFENKINIFIIKKLINLVFFSSLSYELQFRAEML